MKNKVLFLCLLIPHFIVSQNINREKLDSLFYVIEKSGKGMGNLSLFYDGKEIYQKSYGFSDIVNNKPINKETKFRIGSISKTFTATIIMKLIEDGKLNLETTLDKFYPQIHNAGQITMRHLLQHRSGINNFMGTTDYLQWYTKYHTKNQILERIVNAGIVFPPDEKFQYSNSNYVLLTWIAEEVSGKSFTDLLSEIVVKPCNLKNTYIGKKINPDNNETLSYKKMSGWVLEPEMDMSIAYGAGFIVSTATDLNVFLSALFNNKLVSLESLNQMKTIRDGFGLGLIQVPFYEKKGYGHTGGLDGFQANAFYFPDDKLSISLTSNAVDFPLNDIIVGILSIYFGKEYNIPEFKETVNLSVGELVKYTGVYSSPSFPLKITIKVDGGILTGQATGQPSFPLEFAEGNKFKFDMASLEMEFYPEKNEMVLKQMGSVFTLKKE